MIITSKVLSPIPSFIFLLVYNEGPWMKKGTFIFGHLISSCRKKPYSIVAFNIVFIITKNRCICYLNIINTHFINDLTRLLSLLRHIWLSFSQTNLCPMHVCPRIKLLYYCKDISRKYEHSRLCCSISVHT